MTIRKSNKWISIQKFLPLKLDIGDIEYDKKVKKTIDYIEKERESLLYEGKIPEQSYIFFVPLFDEVGLEITDFNVGKFLVFLERKDIIWDLHLPIFIKETENKKVIEIKPLTPVWFSPGGAVKKALQSSKEFRNQIPRLKIKNWEKFLETKRQLEELEEKRKIGKEISKKPKNGWLVFHTKGGVELKFSEETGDFKFGVVEGNLALETNEYKIFLCLLKHPSYKARYTTLLKLMYPHKEFKEPLKRHQVERWALDSVIRNIKTRLGILPRKKPKNKDIFQTLKKWRGYRLKLMN